MELNLPLLSLDAVLFEQAVFNLLDNAAKYSPPRSKVEVRAARTDKQVQISISDEGDGIPPGDVERIFDKFYRVQASDKKRAGTGLGLAISRGFIESVGGTLIATNRSTGHGAVFTITLPIPEAATERAA
jgi:two-component system sensor histidine kinase KdpD